MVSRRCMQSVQTGGAKKRPMAEPINSNPKAEPEWKRPKVADAAEREQNSPTLMEQLMITKSNLEEDEWITLTDAKIQGLDNKGERPERGIVPRMQMLHKPKQGIAERAKEGAGVGKARTHNPSTAKRNWKTLIIKMKAKVLGIASILSHANIGESPQKGREGNDPCGAKGKKAIIRSDDHGQKIQRNAGLKGSEGSKGRSYQMVKEGKKQMLGSQGEGEKGTLGVRKN